jgi:hypothetical protein
MIEFSMKEIGEFGHIYTAALKLLERVYRLFESHKVRKR